METTGVLATVLAVWGIIFTVNSATSAFFQTKWMHDIVVLLRRIDKKMGEDDLRK